eukprot:2046741-Pyramimonas_sp.AAC.1
MALGVASFLQELDAREHSQLRAMFREVKADVHWAMEQDCILRATAEPQEGHVSPTQWVPEE